MVVPAVPAPLRSGATPVWKRPDGRPPALATDVLESGASVPELTEKLWYHVPVWSVRVQIARTSAPGPCRWVVWSCGVMERLTGVAKTVQGEILQVLSGGILSRLDVRSRESNAF